MADKLVMGPAQAVYMAASMERRAVRLYERAALVFSQGRLRQVMDDLLMEERSHLQGFERLQRLEGAVSPEDAQLLDQRAAGTLFEGGLTGAVREGAFDSAVSLLRFAADEEERAAATYERFAEGTHGQTRETFLLIARQERRHLERLLGQLYLLEETGDA